MHVDPPPSPKITPLSTLLPASTFNHTCTLLGRMFTRPLYRNFTPADDPDYWLFHLAISAEKVYAEEPDVRSFLLRNSSNIRWFTNGTTQAVGYLHEGHACLIFRGTKGALDIGVDLLSFLWGTPGCHFGFYLGWKKVEREVITWLQSLPPRTGLVISGHSLGGALAVLSAFDIHNKLPDLPILAVRTFGCPRVGSIQFVREYRTQLGLITQAFKVGADGVTIIPPPPLFIHVSPRSRLTPEGPVATDPLGSLSYIKPSNPLMHKESSSLLATADAMLTMLARNFNYTDVPERMFSRDPLIAAVIVAFTFVAFFTNVPRNIIAYAPAWVTILAHSRLGIGLLFVVAFIVVQQLTYLIPARIPWFVRSAVAVSIVTAIALLHVHLLWLAPTLAWTFVIVALLLRALLPSVADHSMRGYLDALALQARTPHRSLSPR